MDSAFSHHFSECHCHYSMVSPSAGHPEKHVGSQLHPARLRNAFPLFLYPHASESRLYEGPYPGGAPLMPYLGPFHSCFSMYECALEPAFIQKRNERERQRVKCVNQGYAKLRDHLPGMDSDKRMSKVETLRSAIRYIKHLQRLVEGCEAPKETESTKDKNLCSPSTNSILHPHTMPSDTPVQSKHNC